MAVDRNKLIASAQKNLQRGQVQKALRDYEAVAAAFPDDIRILLKIGDLQAREGLFDQAVRTYNEVADYYVAHGFFLKAVAVYKQLLRIKKGDTGAQMRLADLYAQLGLFSDSLAQYNLVAQQLQSEGQSGPYLQVLKRMVELDPSRVGNRIKLAEQFLKLSDVENAVEQFSAACDTLEAEGRFEEFIKVAERMMNQRPNDVPQVKRLASVYLEVGKAQNAIGILQPLFRSGSYDPEAIELLIDALENAGQADRAKSILRELIPVFEGHDRAAELRRAYELLSRLDPADMEARRFLHGDEAELLDFELVSESGGGLSEEDRATVERMLSETDVYMKYNLHDKALAHLSQILLLDPKSIPGLTRRAEVYEASGNKMMAANDLVQLIELIAASGRAAESVPDLMARLARTNTDSATIARAERAASSMSAQVHELDDFEVIDEAEESEESHAPSSVALDEFDALFGDDAVVAMPTGGDAALDQDEDFIREIESSLSAPAGAGTVADSDTVTLAAHDFLPAELDEQLERASRIARSGELSEAHALLLELMGDWPEHAESILRTLDDLPSSEEAAAVSSNVPAVSSADSLDSLFYDEDDDDFGNDSGLGDSGLGDSGMGNSDFDDAESRVTDASPADDADLVEDSDDVLDADLAFDDDDDGISFDDIEAEEMLDLEGFSAGASGSFVAAGPEVSAPVGRASDSVNVEFGPSVAAMETADQDFVAAMNAVRIGSMNDAFELLQDLLFGDHPVAASFELARVRVQLGEFNDAAGALEALENAPGLSADDIALIRYHRSICYEAMSDSGRAREIWQSLIRNSLSVFPDLPMRLARTS